MTKNNNQIKSTKLNYNINKFSDNEKDFDNKNYKTFLDYFISYKILKIYYKIKVQYC